MSTEQSTQNIEAAAIRTPELCTVEVGQTQVLLNSLSEFRQPDDHQQPNLELKNLQEEAEYLYHDHQKLHQKLKCAENEIEELKERNVVLQAELTTAEQEVLMERVKSQKQAQEQDNLVKVIKEKNEEIETLKQAIVAQSEECASLKQKQAENSMILVKYDAAVKECTRLETENKILETLMADYKQCKENIMVLQNENNDITIRHDEMTTAMTLMNAEITNLKLELQGVQALYDLKDEQHRHESERRKKLEKKLKILQGEIETPLDMNRSNQRFELRRSYLPECERCKSCLFQNGVANEECKYHPSKPLPYRSWIRMLPGTITDGRSSKNLYWQCCKQFSTIEPEGCTSHPQHVIRPIPDLVPRHNC